MHDAGEASDVYVAAALHRLAAHYFRRQREGTISKIEIVAGGVNVAVVGGQWLWPLY